MKTLKDIVAAIDALPAVAFKGTYGHSAEIDNAINRGFNRWYNSNERVAADAADEADRNKRRKKDADVARARAASVRKWLKEGFLAKGTFIKVTGARDGHGIREYISHDDRTLHCRQWLPVRFGRHEAVNPDQLRSRGWLKVDDQWIEPQTQMTTHEYDKVVKIL